MNFERTLNDLEDAERLLSHDNDTGTALRITIEVLEDVVKELKKIKAGADYTANTVACLANGIQPD
jgi:hypothetical protein